MVFQTFPKTFMVVLPVESIYFSGKGIHNQKVFAGLFSKKATVGLSANRRVQFMTM